MSQEMPSGTLGDTYEPETRIAVVGLPIDIYGHPQADSARRVPHIVSDIEVIPGDGPILKIEFSDPFALRNNDEMNPPSSARLRTTCPINNGCDGGRGVSAAQICEAIRARILARAEEISRIGRGAGN